MGIGNKLFLIKTNFPSTEEPLLAITISYNSFTMVCAIYSSTHWKWQEFLAWRYLELKLFQMKTFNLLFTAQVKFLKSFENITRFSVRFWLPCCFLHLREQNLTQTQEWIASVELVIDIWSLDLENFSFSFYHVYWYERGGAMQLQDNYLFSFASTLRVDWFSHLRPVCDLGNACTFALCRIELCWSSFLSWVTFFFFFFKFFNPLSI